MNKQTAGFTLMELMIVIAIIGILAAIAYPSYQDKIQKSRRADATGALLGFASAMERHATVKNNYCNAGGAGGANDAVACPDGDATNDTGTPTIYATTSPVDGGEAYYNLTISAASATAFTLTATPTGKQATDKCGTLTLTNTGTRGTSSGLPVADCW
jgi:type IV pilus assembly protein PilE